MYDKDLSEERQLHLIKEFVDNPDVFEEIYQFYYEMILKYLMKRTLSAEAAYDLTAETFIKAFENFEKFKWKGISIKVWLYRIAINSLKNYRRKPEFSPLTEVLEGHESLIHDVKEELKEMDKLLFGDEELSKLSDAIETLKPGQQNVISLYYFNGFSQAEIAKIIDKSEGNVKVMIHRAISSLRTILSPNLA